jgi:hypothetical protein
MLIFFLGVASAAVNGLEPFRMGELFCIHITVATGALQCSVRRGPEGSRIEGWRHSRLPLGCAGSGFVATHAGLASWQRLRLLGAEGHSQQESKEGGREESDEKTVLSSQSHTICPGRGTIIVEFQSTL